MKSQNILNRKVVISVMALSLVTVVYLNSVDKAQAWSWSDGESLVSRVAVKLGLKETEVEAVANEFRYQRAQQRQQDMKDRLKSRLQDRVTDGILTTQQELSLLEKHEELEAKYDDLYNLSPEDRREARADMRDELDVWAKENGIDMNNIHQFNEQHRGNQGRGMGYRK